MIIALLITVFCYALYYTTSALNNSRIKSLIIKYPFSCEDNIPCYVAVSTVIVYVVNDVTLV